MPRPGLFVFYTRSTIGKERNIYKEECVFEVYVGRVDGVIKYVGHGKKGRHKHLNSGVSHIYQANQLHFSGGCVGVSVDDYKTKEEASRIEKELIAKHKPEWNTFFNPDSLSLTPDIQYWLKTAERNTKWSYKLGALILNNLTPRGVVFIPRKLVGGSTAVLYKYRKGILKEGIEKQIPFVESVSLDDGFYRFVVNMEVIKDRSACDKWRRLAPRDRDVAAVGKT